MEDVIIYQEVAEFVLCLGHSHILKHNLMRHKCTSKLFSFYEPGVKEVKK